MPIFAVRHRTIYTYRQPVSFGEHRIMFRPRDSFDQRLLDWQLEISPRPYNVRWIHDVFGNCVALATFDRRANDLRFDCFIRIDHRAVDGFGTSLPDVAGTYPISYGDEMPDLARCMERLRPDPTHEVDRWARQFLRADGQTDSRELLASIAQTIRNQIAYVRREERGVQDPARTLRLGSGSCRDVALLMMDAVRSLGFAAQFVSGYIYSPAAASREAEHLGGGATHAWVRVYLPGAGWVEFDPTNGIIGTRDLIRVAAVREPHQAVPLSGTWTGFPADNLDMVVSVSVSAEPEQPSAMPIAV
jgi:transglutaminase-like putative cysteine protease